MTSFAGAIRAGRAYLEVGVKDTVQQSLKRIEAKVRGFGQVVNTIGGGLFKAGAGLAAPFALAVKSASTAEETLNAFNAVFKDQARQAGEFVENLARRVGRSETQLRGSITNFQAMFVGLGFDPGQARQMSQTLQELALDFASFRNISDEEAAQRFLSALSGSTEVLDQFGINLKMAAIEQQLLGMGITKSTAQASEQEKTLARVALIYKSLGAQGAVGDATRTAGSFANQLKRAKAVLAGTAVTVGAQLLPVVTQLLKSFGQGAVAAEKWVQANAPLVRQIAGLSVAAVAAGAGLLVVGKGASVVSLVLSLVTAAVGLTAGALSSLLGLLAGLGGVLTLVVSPLGVAAALTALLAGSASKASGALDGWAASNRRVAATTQDLQQTGAATENLFQKTTRAASGLVGQIGGFLSGAWQGVTGFIGQVVGRVKHLFGEIAGTATTAFGGVKDALAAGDWQLAFQIALTGLQLVWLQFTDALQDAWSSVANFVADVWDNVMLRVTKAVSHARETIADDLLDLSTQDGWAGTWLEGPLAELMDGGRPTVDVSKAAQRAKDLQAQSLQQFADRIAQKEGVLQAAEPERAALLGRLAGQGVDVAGLERDLAGQTDDDRERRVSGDALAPVAFGANVDPQDLLRLRELTADIAIAKRVIEDMRGAAFRMAGTDNFQTARGTMTDRYAAERNRMEEDARRRSEERRQQAEEANAQREALEAQKRKLLEEQAAKARTAAEQAKQKQAEQQAKAPALELPQIAGLGDDELAKVSQKQMEARRENLGVELGSREGQKAVLDALYGRDDPQKKIAAGVQQAAAGIQQMRGDVHKLVQQGKDAQPLKVERI